MTEFLTVPDIMWEIIKILLMGFAGLFMIYLNYRFRNMRKNNVQVKESFQEAHKKIEKDFAHLELEIDEVKENYLDKFEKISNKLDRNQETVLKFANQINSKLEKQIGICETVQRNKSNQ